MHSLRRKILFVTIAAAVLVPTLVSFAIDDVFNLQGTAGDTEVTLNWDAVPTADHYRIYYGTEPAASDEAYNLPTITTADSSTTYTITGLTNGVTYYFSSTAVGGDDESINYSEPELSLTPQAPADSGSGDEASPDLAITGVDVPNNESVVVTFNKAVVLPASANTEFSITYNFDESALAITQAEFEPGNETQTKVLLTTVPQEPGGEYTLNIPDSVLDVDGVGLPADKRVEIFLGSDVLPGEDAVTDTSTDDEIIADVNATASNLTIVDAAAPSPTQMVITFSEPVVLPSLGDTAPFAIVNNSDPSELLAVENFTLDTQDPSKVVLTTAQQKGVTYTVVVANVTDVDGNVIAAASSTVEVSGAGTTAGGTPGPGADTVAPEDATAFKAALENVAQVLVALTWTKSVNSAGDLVEYVLYKSADGGTTFQEVRTIAEAGEARAVLNNLQADKAYTFKLTAKDTTGNESAGAIASITLPETGPGIGLLALGSLVGGRLFARKRKKK